MTFRGMINATLENAAAVAMSSDFDAMFSDGIVNELTNEIEKKEDAKSYLIVLMSKSIETFLNDVVSVEILDQRDNMDRQGIAESLDLQR